MADFSATDVLAVIFSGGVAPLPAEEAVNAAAYYEGVTVAAVQEGRVYRGSFRWAGADVLLVVLRGRAGNFTAWASPENDDMETFYYAAPRLA